MARGPAWRETASQRVAQWTAAPLLVLALLTIPLVLVPALVELPPSVDSAFLAADWMIWMAFAAEYLLRFSLAVDHRRYFREHLLDLLFVVLPMLRPLRAVRALRALRAGTAAAVVVERFRDRIISRAALFALATAALVVVVAAAVVLDIEGHNPNANINDFGDAVWWAVTTVTTVGYGDRYPVTGAGRAVAGGLMVVGIAVIGVATASVAAWLVRLDQRPGQAREQSDLRALHAEVQALRKQVELLVSRDQGRAVLGPANGDAQRPGCDDVGSHRGIRSSR